VEAAVLEMLRKGKVSDLDITVEFEKEFAKWLGVKYALAHNTGTTAVHRALFSLGIGREDDPGDPETLGNWGLSSLVAAR
jgi:perosamine synthetase